MDPPVVRDARLAGWERVAETTERPFVAGPVSVTARTVRYEPAADPEPRPFFFASRLRIRPDVPPNALLTRIVERGARDGFRETLAERDVDRLDHRGDREVLVDDPAASPATCSTFRGRCVVAGDPVPIEALLAVWEAGEYLLAGGAYRIDDDPAAARTRLLGLVRAVRAR
ncbi:hypothetical protein GRS48_09485 [Halorubrum sp. JWXQ-INN 858]|uniref:hypothetical protein n=1 Tax=Halorubrum sp. JWXQ-INN 858 TaxID=2690782 RepID=UPI001359EB8E|nr:hypothetical protein [Halorubrum sp. JWXQ-INN 858]MWV65048.1 hypothetical protein [Halorubrum sp. JWXQ-INN 858]